MSSAKQPKSSCCDPPPAKTEAGSRCVPAADSARPPADEPQAPPSCCPVASSSPTAAQTAFPPVDEPWIEGTVDTPVGPIPRVGTELRCADRAGSWRARWAIGRMHYTVPPGLYAVGRATPESPVFVSANYKMSFDRLRSRLGGRDGWILVLDTRGINVWCAGGKGTFGTEELVARAQAVRLGEVVSHRKLVVPQLGANGVSAHEVRKRSGFRVIYGPVRAEDLPAFLDAGMKATPAMRRVRFPLRDRVVLIPIELVMAAKWAVLVAVILGILAGFGPGVYSWTRALAVGSWAAVIFLGTCLAAVVLTPALLPWLPGRAFSLKGVWIGLAIAGAVAYYGSINADSFVSGLSMAACFLALPAVASFLAMNFTGASTYTSLSGVRREMRLAVPFQIVCGVTGLLLWIAGRFV